MKRKSHKRRRTNPRILLVVEGETEKNYFLGIKQDPDLKKKLSALTVKVELAKKQASTDMVEQTLSLIDAADREGNPYDAVWLVFDHDHNPKRHEAWRAAQQYASLKNHIAFSSIAFEQWYLLHFAQSARPYPTSAALIKALKKFLPDYQKAQRNDFLILKDHLDKGLENANWLHQERQKEETPIYDQNPVTTVHLLVAYLLSVSGH